MNRRHVVAGRPLRVTNHDNVSVEDSARWVTITLKKHRFV